MHCTVVFALPDYSLHKFLCLLVIVASLSKPHTRELVKIYQFFCNLLHMCMNLPNGRHMHEQYFYTVHQALLVWLRSFPIP
jgi:hypothetical protein